MAGAETPAPEDASPKTYRVMRRPPTVAETRALYRWAGWTDIPQWLEVTSMLRAWGSRQAFQSTIPSLREKIEIASMCEASGASRSSQCSSQHSPSAQSVEKTRRMPRSPSVAIILTVRRTFGETASGSATGEPSITRAATLSGSRTASERARAPPRL